ncbi:ABC transporter ATP-binding protein [Pseudorhodoferax soli]|uniref:ATP-binding cassette subfamily B protein n=1 Tax=Pseudorhodoferax soli TaxID=545864 RepID=A0A368XBV6_9BURK|nr:ABC transporter ATP-binding protein [Pseudorhodoferax soli]RCW65199.1 ATP-binding cassette subfamily B protein [Pseudorhodoferax soli]
MPAAEALLPARPAAFLWHYVRRRPLLFGTLGLLIVAGAACSVGVQYGMKLIVDAMALGDRHSRAIWVWLALFIVLIAAESLCWRLGGWLGCHAVVATGVDVRLDMFRHLSGHSQDYFSRHMAGSLGNRVTATAGATGSILGTLVWKILPPCVDFVGAVVVLWTVDVRMALALAGFVAVMGVVLARFGRRARPLQQRFAEQAAQVGGELVDVVANIWTVQAFGARAREHRRLQAAFGLEAQAQRRSWLYLEKVRAAHDLCLWLMAGGMLAWVVQAWRAGEAMPGDVVVVSALTFRILHGSRDLALSLVDASQQFGVIADMLQAVAVPHEVADGAGAAPLAAGPGEIRIEALRFAYPGQPAVFRGLDLHIPAGQRVGIVGPSGAGKSTLLRLITRTADPDAGRILVDGQPIAQVQQASLRAAIGVVPQDVSLLHRSVMENLRYGRPQATDAEVLQAARDAHCDGFVRALAQGYATVVGERGARLSGGQRQRIGIARAMLKNAPILLLDEATSALDSRSEGEIQRALDRLMRGRTVLAVAHRLSTVAGFDRILVMAEGRIVEDGPPQQLRGAGGLYAQLWAMQAEGLETG